MTSTKVPPRPAARMRSSTATAAGRRPSIRSPSGLFAYASFAIMVGGWAAFGVALTAFPEALDDVWASVRGLPLPLEALVWLLGFPFLVGLAIWRASWDEPVRLAAIAVLAIAYTYMFVPRKPRR
ncbi:MAG TPA: hypothetical protein VHJ39_04045 [Solirubrobacteraceae bacterium]|nr:hypothetical protein [Solirubrobacteraceae bacterium]